MDDHCILWLGSPCSLEERKAALLGRHYCLEKGSFSGLRRELLRRRHQRRRCDLVLEACWIAEKRKVVGRFHTRNQRVKEEEEKGLMAPGRAAYSET